ncbi:MAG: NAD synthetase [Actinomycetota bacterium]
METTASLDLVIGLIALIIVIGGLFMLFSGISSFPKDK